MYTFSVADFYYQKNITIHSHELLGPSASRSWRWWQSWRCLSHQWEQQDAWCPPSASAAMWRALCPLWAPGSRRIWPLGCVCTWAPSWTRVSTAWPPRQRRTRTLMRSREVHLIKLRNLLSISNRWKLEWHKVLGLTKSMYSSKMLKKGQEIIHVIRWNRSIPCNGSRSSCRKS